jgi:aromatic-L-amino-acid decarboxylase
MARKRIYVIAATFQEHYIIRFVVCSRVTESRDIAFAWDEIRTQTDEVLSENIDHVTEMPVHRN